MNFVDLPLKHPNISPVLNEIDPRYGILKDLPITGNGWAGFVDRSGAIVLPKMSVLSDVAIPSFDPNFTKSLEQVMLETAQALLATGRPINLFWSGGIDSMGVALALREAGGTASQVTVTCNENSAAEYPAGMKMISDSFIVDLLYGQPISTVERTGNRLNVTGDFGDFLFPPVVRKENLNGLWLLPQNAPKLQNNWLEFFTTGKLEAPSNLESSWVSSPSQAGIDLLMAFVAKAPFKIESLLQFYFWWQFCTKWQTVWVNRSIGSSPAEFMTYPTRFTPFYGSTDLQRWAMKNASLGVATPSSFKMIKKPLKELINKWLPDQAYYDNKEKEGSLNSKSWIEHQYLGKLVDGRELKTSAEVINELRS